MGTPDDVIGLSTIYMRIYFCGMPFLCFITMVRRFCVLSAIQRDLLSFDYFGLYQCTAQSVFVIVCKLDVAGVAIGTIVSQFVSSVLVLYCLSKADTSYKLCFNKLAIDKEYMLQIFRWEFRPAYRAQS